MAKKQIKGTGGKTPKSTKTGKGGRVPTQPPGMPQGSHDQKNPTCQCGRCSNKRLGR